MLPICRSAAFGLLAAEHALGDPAVDALELRRAAPRGRRARSRRVALFLSAISARGERQRRAQQRARQRQLRVAGVALHRRRVAQEGGVDQPPRHALQDLIAPALGLEHARVCGVAGRRAAAAARARAASSRRMIAREPTSRSPPMRMPGTVVPP